MHIFLTIKELLDGYAKKTFSPHEIFAQYKKQYDLVNKELNAVIELFESDAAPLFDPSKLLSAIPYFVKDNICQKNKITSAGSRILSNYKAPYSATVINKLSATGAVSIGRTNMDEFAMGGSGEYSAYGPTTNPWNKQRSPGGSSAGSAAAVAAGLAPFALGSETGGSVRQPASFCNLVGMYPTYGRVSRFGLMAFASSTDQIGVISRTVYDNALVMSTIAGHDEHDMTSLPEKKVDFTQGIASGLPQGLKIGILKDALESPGIDEQVRARFQEAIELVKKMGAQVSVIEIPNLKHAVALYFIINYAEAASNLSRFDGSLYGLSDRSGESLTDMYIKTRHRGFGNEVKRRILLGNYVLSAGHRDAYYVRAQKIREQIRQEFMQAFTHVDVLMSPTSSVLPFTLGSVANDPIAMYISDYFTVPNCMTGTPAISVPAGFSREKLPIGIQFLGAAYSEALLYKIAHAFEQETCYYKETPDFSK